MFAPFQAKLLLLEGLAGAMSNLETEPMVGYGRLPFTHNRGVALSSIDNIWISPTMHASRFHPYHPQAKWLSDSEPASFGMIVPISFGSYSSPRD